MAMLLINSWITDSLADACAAKCADFAAFCKWANKIDDLDPCFQDLCRGVLAP
jgi:hypothetical protein